MSAKTIDINGNEKVVSSPAATVTVPQGGTGLTTVSQGDTLYASASDTLARLAKDTNTTRYLANTGTTNNPKWDLVDLSNGVTGILSSANMSTGSMFKFSRRVNKYMFTGDTGSLIGIGMSTSETLTGTSTVTVQKDSAGYYRRYATGTTSGSATAVTTATTQSFWIDHNPAVEIHFRTGPDITTVRYWFGIFSSAPTNADTITGRVLAFRYSTVAGDTSWTTVMRDNVTTSVGSAVGSIALSTNYVLRISVTGGGTTVEFSVLNGLTFATIGTTSLSVPAGALGNDVWFGSYLFNTAGNNRSFDWKATHSEMD